MALEAGHRWPSLPGFYIQRVRPAFSRGATSLHGKYLPLGICEEGAAIVGVPTSFKLIVVCLKTDS